MMAGAIEWILENLELEESDPVAAIYDRTESQSGECLPVIYRPFDGRQRMHFVDRGQILDYAATSGRNGGRVLDFGPGDGWPSLLIAPMVDEVVGVEGSEKRVEVCTRNAGRMGIKNVRFVHVPPGERLPFEDNAFDGVAAASSIEQTPDPKATLRELHRVLKPGGLLRAHYESLNRYQGGKERDVWLSERRAEAFLVVFDRDIEQETVRHYGLFFRCAGSEVGDVFARAGQQPSYDGLSSGVLAELAHRCCAATTWMTRHPSCRSLLTWMHDIGFHWAKPTHDGGRFAGDLFDRLAESERPVELRDVERLLRPPVAVAVELEAPNRSCPGEWEPWVTACK
jgi:ubiquinone/menaquinone biosynthesis C-methylase UbiE